MHSQNSIISHLIYAKKPNNNLKVYAFDAILSISNSQRINESQRSSKEDSSRWNRVIRNAKAIQTLILIPMWKLEMASAHVIVKFGDFLCMLALVFCILFKREYFCFPLFSNTFMILVYIYISLLYKCNIIQFVCFHF